MASKSAAKSTTISTTIPPSKPTALHCVRCHTDFHPTESTKKGPCTIQHDYESFEGSRNNTSWYTGILTCCNADYKFHRRDSREKADPKYCFQGEHTVNPEEVEYNGTTMRICTASTCGKKLHAATKEAYRKQKENKAKAASAKRKAREADKKSKRQKIDELKKEGKTREARKLRAEMLGMDPNDPGLNSEEDPDGCEEFDFASDSSLVPPWEMDSD